MATKTVAFRIKLEGDDELSNDLVRLNKQLQELTEEKKRLDEKLKDDSVKKSAEEIDRLNKELLETTINIKATRGELGKQQKDFVKIKNAVKQTSGSYNELVQRNQALRSELKRLPNAFDKTNQEAKDLATQIRKNTDELKKFDSALGDNFREVGNYGKALDGLSDKLKNANFNISGSNVNLQSAGGLLQNIIPQIAKFGGIWGIAAAAVVGAGVAATDALLDLTKEINKTNSEVQKLFNVTDLELQKLTAGIQATADTFGKDFNEILKVSNTLAKEFGLTGEEALDKIQKGFLAGADINGEFLDILREYPTQFRESGFTADEFIGIITKETKEGIFSDKGVDAVKEFGLAIREQTDAAKIALEQAFGKNFSDKLLKGVRDGSISTAQALKQVSTALGDSSIQADKAGAVLADLFKGAGEDAGLRFIKSLTDISTNLDDIVDETDKYTASQIKLLDANERIEFAQQQIVAAFDLTGDELSALGDEVLAFILEALVKLIDVGVDVINFFINLNNESTLARGVFEFFSATVSSSIDLMVTNFKVLFKAIEALVTFDFKKGFKSIANDFKSFGSNTATSFTEAFENTIKLRKPIEKINKETLFKPAEKAGEEAGKALGEGLIAGVQTVTTDKAKSEALAKKANDAAAAAFKKFFEPLKEVDIEADIKEVIKEVDIPVEEFTLFEKLFGFSEEDEANLLNSAKDLAANITQEVNAIVFAGKQKRLREETDAEQASLQEQSNKEILELEARKDRDLLNTNLTSEQKLLIREKFEKDKLELQAKLDKQSEELELEAAKKSRKIQANEAVISALLSAGRALANPPGFPFTIPVAALALGEGLARAAAIRATPLALGGDFVTSGPQLLMVGDNPGGQERVQVTPLSSPNVNGPTVNQNFMNQQQGLDTNGMREMIASAVIMAISEIPVRVSQAEINRVQKEVEVIQGDSGF